MKPAPISRRRALQALGAALLAGSAGRLLSATRARAAVDAAGPGMADFTDVSRRLTGKPDPDPALALALYHAMRQATPDLDAALAALRDVLSRDGLADDRTAFAEAQKPQQALAQAILQAWYLGVVGKGGKASCIAYVETLANRAVAAELVPPSFSYGPCGTWSARP
ncbi:sugar dehydrogenase complex small subunit [Massilia sp. TN1-12]|uniref:sugar dehydrogenase complex small subunit n=1 Tax=Massilia paldalensis TaxID=3377675 RepID=UPI00384EBB96